MRILTKWNTFGGRRGCATRSSRPIGDVTAKPTCYGYGALLATPSVQLGLHKVQLGLHEADNRPPAAGGGRRAAGGNSRLFGGGVGDPFTRVRHRTCSHQPVGVPGLVVLARLRARGRHGIVVAETV